LPQINLETPFFNVSSRLVISQICPEVLSSFGCQVPPPPIPNPVYHLHKPLYLNHNADVEDL